MGERRRTRGPEAIGVVVDRLLRGLGIKATEAKAPVEVSAGVCSGVGDAHRGTVTGAKPEWHPRRPYSTIAAEGGQRGAMASGERSARA